VIAWRLYRKRPWALEERATDSMAQARQYKRAAERTPISSLQTKLIIAFGFRGRSIVTVGSLQYRNRAPAQPGLFAGISQNQEFLTELTSVRNILNRTDASFRSFVAYRREQLRRSWTAPAWT